MRVLSGVQPSGNLHTGNYFVAIRQFVKLQEEPKNAGAWRYMHEPRMELIDGNFKLKYVGRPESASPATGFLSTHQYEQKLLVDEALS